MLGIVLISTLVTPASAETFSFEFIDSKNYTVSYVLSNATLMDVEQFPPEEFVFTINGTNGEINVQLPKNIPRYIHDDFPAFVLLNGNESYEYGESDCFYDFVYPVKENTKLQFIFSYPPERPLPIYYEELPTECSMMNDVSDRQSSIKEVHCSNDALLKAVNIRNEVVCIFSSSVNKLLERMYLLPTEYVVMEK